MPKILTANLLATGTVVFLGADGLWVDDVAAARIFTDATAAEEGLAIGQRDAKLALIVDPFVTEKGPEANGKPGMTLRDSIRAFGPTIAFLPADTQGGVGQNPVGQNPGGQGRVGQDPIGRSQDRANVDAKVA